MAAPHSTTPKAERALLVAVDLGDRAHPLEPEFDEFRALATAAGAHVVGELVQRRPSVDPSTMIGGGKVRELGALAEERDATTVFVFNDLAPRQRTNLEKATGLAIVDRTALILDLFAQHARSREGKLQVELAQLRYRQSNLIGAGSALSRLGGGIGTRGPGETKLEVDRRKIQRRITTLRRALETVRVQRATRRPRDAREPLVALVGYTNVGKSSLLNRLANTAPAQGAFVADQPFATLDPTLRHVRLNGERSIRLVDTVGFITALPEELVTAFRATLEELDDADLLLHVIDGSNPDWMRQKESVETILRDLHLEEKPVVLVFNKADMIADSHALPGLIVSAATGRGLDALREAIAHRLP